MNASEKLQAYEVVHDALKCAPHETIYEAAARIIAHGEGRLDIAYIIAPPISSEESWKRIEEAAAKARAPYEIKLLRPEERP